MASVDCNVIKKLWGNRSFFLCLANECDSVLSEEKNHENSCLVPT